MGTRREKTEKKQGTGTGKPLVPTIRQTPEQMFAWVKEFVELRELQQKWFVENSLEGNKSKLVWEKIKDEKKSVCKQMIETRKLWRKTKDPIVKESLRRRCYEEHNMFLTLWDHPSRYLDLKFRIESGIQTGLSEDDKKTVLHALSHGASVERLRNERKDFSNKAHQWSVEVGQWREAYFKGGETQRLERIDELVKKLNLTGHNYVDNCFDKKDLVKACYMILAGKPLPDSNITDALAHLLGGYEKFDSLFTFPDLRSASEDEIKNIKRNAVTKTCDIFNTLVGMKILDGDFAFASDYSCYQFLRKMFRGERIPKFLSTNSGKREIDKRTRVILQGNK